MQISWASLCLGTETPPQCVEGFEATVERVLGAITSSEWTVTATATMKDWRWRQGSVKCGGGAAEAKICEDSVAEGVVILRCRNQLMADVNCQLDYRATRRRRSSFDNGGENGGRRGEDNYCGRQ